MLKFTTAEEHIKIENIKMMIYGDPGLGKTSLCFTAKNPILFDFDQGVFRALNRKDTVRVDSLVNKQFTNRWEDIIKITADELKEYDTLCVDTVGTCIKTITDWLRRTNPGKYFFGTNLTPAGWGVVANHFEGWLNQLIKMNKNVVLIAHVAQVAAENDQKPQKIPQIPGKKTNELLYPMFDVIGHLYLEGDKKFVEFNPSPSTRTKGFKNYSIPDLRVETDFLQKIIDESIEKFNQKTEEQKNAEDTFAHGMDLIKAANTSEDLLAVMNNAIIKNNKVLQNQFKLRVTELNLKYDKDTQSFVGV